MDPPNGSAPSLTSDPRLIRPLVLMLLAVTVYMFTSVPRFTEDGPELLEPSEWRGFSWDDQTLEPRRRGPSKRVPVHPGQTLRLQGQVFISGDGRLELVQADSTKVFWQLPNIQYPKTGPLDQVITPALPFVIVTLRSFDGAPVSLSQPSLRAVREHRAFTVLRWTLGLAWLATAIVVTTLLLPSTRLVPLWGWLLIVGVVLPTTLRVNAPQAPPPVAVAPPPLVTKITEPPRRPVTQPRETSHTVVTWSNRYLQDVGHVVGYSLLGVLCFRRWSWSGLKDALLFAMTTEAMQFWTTDRHPSLVDVLFNITGLGLGHVVSAFFWRTRTRSRD